MINPKFYDKEYFDGGKGYHSYEDSSRFSQQAIDLIVQYNPTSVLDFGCAKGFLVKALRERGVEAYGYDVSDYALSQAPKSVKPYVSKRLKRVDLIVSMDTWEHIPLDKLKTTRDKLRTYGNRFHFVVGTVNTPDWEHDPSHVSMYELEYWQNFMPEATWIESL